MAVIYQAIWCRRCHEAAGHLNANQAEDNIQGAPIQDSMTAVHQQAALLAGTTMAHRVFGLFTKSVTLIADQGNDHAVEVEEEHQEVEAKLDERFLKYEFESVIARQTSTKKTDLLVHIQLAENLGRI